MCNVLLVEDNAVNTECFERVLTQDGHKVQSAQSGEEALDKFVRDTFDLILMDIGLPGIDGFETTQRIRSMGFLGPVIAITAYTSNEVRAKATHVGCTCFRSKPISLKDLRAIVKNYFQ